MNATIKTNGQEITGKNLSELRQKLNSMLSADGYRGLTAITDNGTEIHVELYEGQDYVQTANGRLITASEMGRLGGLKTSQRKSLSSAENGKLGGRPRKK